METFFTLLDEPQMEPPSGTQPPDEHRAALALLSENRLTEAEAIAARLTKVRPKDPAVWNTLGTVLVSSGQVESAINAFERALALGAPPAAESNLLFALHTAYGIDAGALFRRIETAGRRFAQGGPVFSHPIEPPRQGRLRVGYLCSFDMGSSRTFIESALKYHDRAALELFGYFNFPVSPEASPPFAESFDAVRLISGISDEAAAVLVYKDKLDVLVDVCGHAHRQRLSLLAKKPAPVQATWIESFFSTGLTAVDYLITDLFHSPPGHPQGFTEMPLRLPGLRLCYTPPPEAPDPGPLPALSNGFLTFGSFNHLSKLNRRVVAAWAAILNKLPSSRLILKWSALEDSGVRMHTAERFAAHGIHPERLELRPFSPHHEMLVQYRDIDIALDPFPYNGGLTTCEALLMGIPVLCLRGGQIISRQSASFQTALGLEEFTAADEQGYIGLALQWSRNIDRLAEVRAELRERLLSSPLCDGRTFTRDLENAYRFMTGRAVLHKAPTV